MAVVEIMHAVMLLCSQLRGYNAATLTLNRKLKLKLLLEDGHVQAAAHQAFAIGLDVTSGKRQYASCQ